MESSKTFLKKNKLKIFVKHIKNFPKIDVVILAGGRGSRVKKFLQNSSKPMIKFGKKHFLEYIIKKVASYPINQIHIMCGYKGKYIFKKYNKKYQNFVPINCYVEKKPLGTGGAFKLIKRKLTNNFIVINGDTYFDIDYSIFFNQKIANKNFIILSKDLNNKKNFKLNNLNINKNKKIFFDKNSNYFNGGIYFFNKSIIKKICKIKNKFISLEKDILQKEINNKKIFGILKKNFFIDIGTEQNLKRGKKLIPKITTKPAIFFDRDGVINYDYGYTYKIKNFIFKPGILNKLNKIGKKRFYIFIVTNQAGIGHGIFSEKQFFVLHKNLKKVLFKKNILINDVKFCPFHKNAIVKKYKKNSKYRKPGNLMIENLKKNWNINVKNSVMIGDKISDEKCAIKSNIKFYYVNKKFDLFIENL